LLHDSPNRLSICALINAIADMNREHPTFLNG
jgi:hypothetical protein